jgi:hypothetical protein
MTTTIVQSAAVAAALAVLAVAGCGGGEGGSGGSERPVTRAAPAESPAPTRPAPAPEPARCPAGSANCASADGTILFVERVDPDGDGDAHFVLTSDENITAPGISVIDVRPGLRPDPLPGPGDRISAAGPVFRGSFGQRQIQADVIHVAPG